MLSGEDETPPDDFPLSDEETKAKKPKKHRKDKKPDIQVSTEAQPSRASQRVTQLETMLKHSSQSSVPALATVSAPKLPKIVKLVLLSGMISCIDSILVIPPLFRDIESKYFFGIAFSAYHFGQILSAPLLGYWSDDDQINRTLFFSSLCGVIGNIVFAFSKRDPLFMTLARFIVGLGAGNILVPWSHIRALSNKKQRYERFLLYGWCVSIGQVLGCVFGLLGQFIADPVHMYLIPGLLMAGIFAITLVLHCWNWFLVRRQGGLAVDPEDFDQALESIRTPISKRCLITRKLLVILLLFGVMSFSYWSFLSAVLPSRASPSPIVWSERDIYVWLVIMGLSATVAHGALQLSSIAPAKVLSTSLPIIALGYLLLFRIVTEIMDWQIYVAAGFVSIGHSWLSLLAPRIIDSDSNERIGLRTSWFFIGVSFCSIAGILSAQWLVEARGLSLVGLVNSGLLLVAMSVMIVNPESKGQGKPMASLNQPLLDQSQFGF